MNAVDTNILLYSLDKSEPAKQAKAQLLLQQLVGGSEPTVLLWQVLAETIHQLRRWQAKGELSQVDFDQNVQTLRSLFSLGVPSLITLDNALDLPNRFSLAYWDSIILGGCVEAGVTTLFTEDMGAPRIIDRIQLVNPLN